MSDCGRELHCTLRRCFTVDMLTYSSSSFLNLPPSSPSLFRPSHILYHALSHTFSHIHLHYPYDPSHSTLYSVEYFILSALVLEIETMNETILHTQRKGRFVLGARGGVVACATEMRDRVTLNALVGDLLKKGTDEDHDAFACVEPDTPASER